MLLTHDAGWHDVHAGLAGLITGVFAAVADTMGYDAITRCVVPVLVAVASAAAVYATRRLLNRVFGSD